jgi:hypothetical protein
LQALPFPVVKHGPRRAPGKIVDPGHSALPGADYESKVTLRTPTKPAELDFVPKAGNKIRAASQG